MSNTVPVFSYPPEPFERRSQQGDRLRGHVEPVRFDQQRAHYGLGKLLVVIGVLSVSLLACAYFVRFIEWNFDDSYIVFRIVRNLIAGEGWVYNAGEYHNASTSVLHTLLVAGVALLTTSILLAAHIVGLVALLLLGTSVFRFFGRIAPRMFALPAALPIIVLAATNSTWGIETNLFIALLAYYLLRETQGRSPWIVLSLLVLTRPDSLVLLAFRGAWETLRKRELPFRALLICAAIILPWCVYSLVTFGQFFPDTLSNKIWQGQSGFWGGGWVYWQGLRAHSFAGLGPLPGLTALLGAIGLLFVVASSGQRRECRGLLLLSFFALTQQCVYLLLNVPGYHWYFAPLEATILLHAWYGCVRIVERQPILARISSSRLGAYATSFLLCGSAAYSLTQSLTHPGVRDVRDDAYQQAMRNFETTYQEPGSLAAVEVGTVGFYTTRRIIDLVGLTTPNPEFLSTTHLEEFFKLQPQFVLLHNPAWPHEKSISSDPRFIYLYEQKEIYSHSFSNLTLFRLRSERANEPFTPEILRRLLGELYVQPLKLNKPENVVSGEEEAVCIIDSINGKPGRTHLIVQRIQPLTVTGWGVDFQGTPEEMKTSILLEGATSFSIPLERVSRPDVSRHLNAPRFEHAGFTTTASLYDVPAGSYTLKLVTERGDRAYSLCDLGQTVELME